MEIVNLILIAFFTIWLAVMGLRLKYPYPARVVETYQLPYVRVMVWMIVYWLAMLNPVVGLLSMVSVVLFQADMDNFLPV